MADTISGITKLSGSPTQARVSVVNTATNLIVASQLSNASTGAFSFAGLPAGTYEIVILKAGYKPQVDGPWTLDGVPPISTWDPAVKGVDITLSNGNRDATKSTASYATVYGLAGRNSGRYAFEVIVTARPSASTMLVGIADKTNTAAILASFLGNQSGATFENSAGYNDDNGSGAGRIFKNMATAGDGFGSASAAYTAGDTITVDVNIAANTVAFLKNGIAVTLGGSPTQAIESGKTWYPGMSLQSGAAGRIVVTGLAYLPSGATAWG
jgi:hypothetical protein